VAKMIQVNSRILQLAKFPQSVEHDLDYGRRAKQVQPKYYSRSSNLEFRFVVLYENCGVIPQCVQSMLQRFLETGHYSSD
jgi:hypothetical protein